MLINRILIVGLGSIGKRHVRLARELLPESDIRVLRHRNCNTVSDNVDGCFTDIIKAIEFAPQIAIVANPATLHISIAEKLALHGIHLLVEKPLSTESINAIELIRICQQQQIILMTGYNLRFLSSLQHFKELISKNPLGKILSLRCEVGQNLESWRPQVDYRKSASAKNELGGGVLLELSHELDYLRWVFGDFSWVIASMHKQSTLDIDVEDTVHVIFGIVNNENSELVGNLNMDFIRHDTKRCCTAICENGSIRWNAITSNVEVYEQNKMKWKEVFYSEQQRDDSYRKQWQHFLHVVNNKKQPLVSGKDGWQVLRVIDAIRLSSSLGSKVYLNELEARELAFIK